jgi:Protein of unknown function (DUF2939)
MRKLILAVFAMALLVCGYGLWPVVAAFEIKRAVKAGDVATLERKVLWAPVRASLKESFAKLEPAVAKADGDDAGVRRGNSFWNRIKAAAAPMLADSFIDRYVTPEGVSQIQQARRGGWKAMLGLTPKVPEGPANASITNALQGGDSAGHADDDANAVTRFVAFYQRLQRARFHSLSKVEFEIADHGTPGRKFVSQFELSNYEWKLASLRVVGVGF